MTSKPESARQFLNNPVFQSIHRRVALHDELLCRIKAALPETMARHCLYCVAREDGGLVVYTDSQAFASQFRFLAPTIQAKLNAFGDLFFRQIVIRNLSLTMQSPTEPEMAPVKTPTPAAIEHVKAGSDCAPNAELAEALARLGASMERYAEKSRSE